VFGAGSVVSVPTLRDLASKRIEAMCPELAEVSSSFWPAVRKRTRSFRAC
jgi:hypothetical protein